jgi:hypothetical protein
MYALSSSVAFLLYSLKPCRLRLPSPLMLVSDCAAAGAVEEQTILLAPDLYAHSLHFQTLHHKTNAALSPDCNRVS